ncbi:17.4 kDa class III heat shock protein-like [Durio zibethinus]|uniref:17.4 kDa class III heat shock protein-like n=1 Tax=Durio zibethinus TaxID=66656 RepID=A0A6P5X6U2_DURZI|nr:17.4 kDa class III heat shock protein-like [Durio zibethinus]
MHMRIPKRLRFFLIVLVTFSLLTPELSFLLLLYMCYAPNKFSLPKQTRKKLFVVPFRVLIHVKDSTISLGFLLQQRLKMSRVAETMTHWFSLLENIEKFMFPPRTQDTHENENKGFSVIPADILDTPKEFIFDLDVPGLSKSDIQVTIENENTLVIKSGGKRKREEVEEEGCKYIRLDRKPFQKLIRKFRLPENANVSAITAKCENGVLTVVVEKLPPPSKPKTVEAAIA